MFCEHRKTQKTAEEFWDGIYKKASPTSSGKPSVILERFVQNLKPGKALDMGCAKGDDAIWLARRGWSVVAVDVSSTAIEYAANNARRSDVEGQVTFERHDLSQTFPEGSFDFVLASYFHSPIAFERSATLKEASGAVVSGGHLLVIEHGSRAPWSWAEPDAEYPTAEEAFATLDLNERAWERVHVGIIERDARGPGGQRATVIDNVIFLRRVES